MSNMDIWDKVKRPPASALKTIQAGRLKGKSDISPQWRLQVMTEMFGPCGKGWSYTIDSLWTEPGINGQVFAFAQVSLFAGGVAIPGIGGSMLLVEERNGMHHNDEAFKMAVTDALSVAMKALGVAADIYLGLWDGSKYVSKEMDVRPNSGAGDDLSSDTKNLIADFAITIKDNWEVNDHASMFKNYTEIKNKGLDEVNYLWSLLDSRIRSAIKKYGQEKG